MNTTALLSSSYFPPIQYFSKLLLHEMLLIEHGEHFQKQTYRNRCHIYGANGLLKLTIPIKHGMGEHTPIKEAKIANDSDWRKVHWRSIESAYRCSPYFEFYEDILKPFYEPEFKYLVDFNQATLAAVLKALKMSLNISYTDIYLARYAENTFDYRHSLSAKSQDTGTDNAFYPKPYQQVFSTKFDFIKNLSIIDLLCNEGPASKSYLESCLLP